MINDQSSRLSEIVFEHSPDGVKIRKGELRDDFWAAHGDDELGPRDEGLKVSHISASRNLAYPTCPRLQTTPISTQCQILSSNNVIHIHV
jgi:hypothetical protein